MNSVVLIGRLTADPEIKYLEEYNSSVCDFCLAVARDFKNKNGEYDTDFFNINLWGKKGETLAQYATKGSLISVSGSLRINKYISKNGESRTYTCVYADKFNFISNKHPKNDSSVYQHNDLFEEEMENDDCEIPEEEIPF